MIKYAKIINEETGLCEVGTGTNTEFYKSIGMTQQDVEQSEKDNQWYLSEKCPHYTPEEIEKQQKQARKQEIESKISELEKMSLNDLLNNNETNLKIYQAVINSLKDSIPKLSGDICY